MRRGYARSAVEQLRSSARRLPPGHGTVHRGGAVAAARRAQLHALAHALTALQQASSHSDSRAPHTIPACDECLLFASIGAALPAHAAALQPVGEEPAAAAPAALASRAEPFRDYASRAPPRAA